MCAPGRSYRQGELLLRTEHRPPHPKPAKRQGRGRRRLASGIKIYTDASYRPGNGGTLAAIAFAANGELLERRVARAVSNTSLGCEYEAALLGCELAHELGQPVFELYCDARVLVQQAAGPSLPRDSVLADLCRALRSALGPARLRWVPRERNLSADALARAAWAA